MRILCIDTSLGASVALWDDCSPTPLLASRSSADSRSHAEHLSDLVSQVIQEACGCALAKAGIEAVAVGRGPAPFTGVAFWISNCPHDWFCAGNSGDWY